MRNLSIWFPFASITFPIIVDWKQLAHVSDSKRKRGYEDGDENVCYKSKTNDQS